MFALIKIVFKWLEPLERLKQLFSLFVTKIVQDEGVLTSDF